MHIMCCLDHRRLITYIDKYMYTACGLENITVMLLQLMIYDKF